MDNMVTKLQTSMDTTVDRLNTEVHGYIRKRRVTRTTWVGVVLLSAANFMSMVTFSTPGWGWTREIAGVIRVAGEYHGLYGVWYVCWTDIDEGYLGMCDLWTTIDSNMKPGWLGGFQAASVLVLMGGFVSFVVQMAYICVPSFNKYSVVILTFAGATFFTGVLTCAQWITFIVGFLRDAFFCCKPELVREITDYKLSYCFIISCVCSGIYFFIAAIVMFEWAVGWKKTKRQMKDAEILLKNPSKMYTSAE